MNYVGELATEAQAWARREITSNPVYNMLTDAQKQAKIALMAEEMFKKPSIQIVEAATEFIRCLNQVPWESVLIAQPPAHSINKT